MMKLFGKEECNTGRQIEFDIAKTVCILGMVFVHCFEELTPEEIGDTSAYYIMVIVLDAIFGAATFMSSMGLGIAYSWKDNADVYIRRGIKIYFCGMLLNLVRASIPNLMLLKLGYSFRDAFVVHLLNDDIMYFAGLALLLFGLLKKAKLSDRSIFAIALGMSIIGSFVRFLTFESPVLTELVGLFFGAYYEINEYASACFPLFNWFIIVVCGYLYGKALRRCKDIKKYYSIALPVSALVLAVYMFIAIPGRLGMMNGDLNYYYYMTSLDVVVCIVGMIFATSLYHYLSLIMSDKVKAVVTCISRNINTTYCIHWVIIGWMRAFMWAEKLEPLSTVQVFVFGTALYIVSNILAETVARARSRRKNA